MLRFLIGGVVCSTTFLLAQQPTTTITVIHAEGHAVSAPLRDYVPGSHTLPAPAAAVVPLHKPGGNGKPGGGGGGGSWTDQLLQSSYPSSFAARLGVSVDGIAANGSIPPDTNLAVGATQMVETVNTEYEVYNKSGGPVFGPYAIHTIFSALGSGSMCATKDGGDPIVLYDQMAGRWLISQLEYNSGFSTNLVCVAVSTSSDATGSYHLYSFNFGSSLPDYPKFGVWPDAYYFSANMFRKGSSFQGAQACAFNRSAMLAGASATGVCFQGTTSLYNILPANLDGSTGATGSTAPPAAGEPNFFLQFVASSTLSLYRFHVDFTTPSNSTFSRVGLSVGTFHEACGGSACVPQPGVNEQLDSLGDRLMYRLSYRNFGTYESLLVNHSVQVASSSNQTGLRWYEIRNPGTSPYVYQQSTYAPSPSGGPYRWMGSIAQDKLGDMLLGYSESSSALYPSLATTGRLAGDAKNQMQSESLFFNGQGSQTTYNRWGDYSSVALDPVNDCTLWFATEYLPATGNFNWHTRLASFKFSGCN